MNEEKNYEEDDEFELTDEEKEKISKVREFFSWCLTFCIAIFVALVIKDHIIINAVVPTGSMENTILPGDNIIGWRLAYKFSEPERGDIIIFDYPDDETQKYVKRIIGLPGDKIYIENSKIYINDNSEPLDEPYLKEEWIKANGPLTYEVPADSYFVLGDNRNNSLDSRYWINTYVKREKIIGQASLCYFPFDRIGIIKAE